MMDDNKVEPVPEMLQDFMYALMKEARRDSFVDFCENWGISYDEDYPKIRAWFSELGIEL
jgi:hypothetical protein